MKKVTGRSSLLIGDASTSTAREQPSSRVIAKRLSARDLLTAHWCVSEVCNGGFHQFFSNPTGVLAPEAASAFFAIGLPRVAGLVQRAMSFFGHDYPRDQDVRNDLLTKYQLANPREWNPFAMMDDEFYQLIDTEGGGWEAAADAYARAQLTPG